MDYLTTKEVSILWNTTEQMVRRYCRDGRIPGAVQKEGAWFVPEGTARPTRKKQEAPTVPKLVKQLQRQRTKKIYHGLYDYIQINFCYSSNRLASNRLMLTQVEEVYKKGKVSVGFEPIKVDDLIEAYNHMAGVRQPFACHPPILLRHIDSLTQQLSIVRCKTYTWNKG